MNLDGSSRIVERPVWIAVDCTHRSSASEIVTPPEAACIRPRSGI
jgi:hypothetical protein